MRVTDLIFRDSPELARRMTPARESTGCRSDGTRHSVLRRQPVPDFLRDNLDNSDTGVVLVSLVDPVTEISEIARNPGWHKQSSNKHGNCERRTSSSNAS